MNAILLSENVLESIQIIIGLYCVLCRFCPPLFSSVTQIFVLFLVVLVSKSTSQVEETGEKDFIRLPDQPVKTVYQPTLSRSLETRRTSVLSGDGKLL